MSEEYESVSLVKNEVFVYRIPPLGSNRGYKAADWKLDCPDWTGRLRLVSVGKKLELRLEDKTTGELFAKAPVDKYPGIAIEPVTDSSRYFVVRLQDESGRNAFIGIGFADRGDSFDLNVALSDHFKYIEKDEKLSQEFAQEASKPKLDLGFKEGQTITINIGGKRTDGTTRPRPSGGVSGGPVPLLPPPPGGAGGRIPPPPPGPTGQRSLSPQEQPHSNVQQSSSTVSASSGGTTGSATSSNDLFSSLDPFISGSASASVSATSSSSGSNIDSLLAVAMAGVSVTAAARLRKDFIRLIKDPVPFVLAAPLSKNILEWHYVVKGPAQSPYEGGLYHGKLVFPPDFPFKPPSIYMLTPNGRFQTNTRLCLSISDYHPDTWNPAWTVSTILTGLLSFMLESQATLGSIQTSDYEKRALARKSRAYNLKNKCFCDLFPDLVKEVREELAKEAAELEAARAAGGGGRLEGENAANDQRLEGSGGIFDHSVTYNVLVLVGVVALAFAVRYVLISAAAGDDSNFSS